MAQFIPTPPNNFTPITRSGGCICGAHRYAYTGAPVEELEVLSCNCGMCTDKGSLNLYLKPEGLTWTKGSWDTLKQYKWYADYYEKHIICHFCETCGTFFGGAGPGYVMLNARTFDRVDTAELKIKPFNARGRTAKMDAEDAARKEPAVAVGV
ncbi:hypothetical protein EXIGLDRAFT_766925 [Exidia glandulosa HHB12029]|uniref:CENP-V/GFA domain-containing protein n=1 Tax=Exidia glandulosa HHB12029 TaxID=1314781 RepID=A0A166AS36_EXIGL|nr:hypothetical protein EXIGLDRAFT_766925 [Exidia glandulosa HHB12029]